ncbi:MAG: glycoside hydrolase family 32 protein [Anaerolineae bacterium]
MPLSILLDIKMPYLHLPVQHGAPERWVRLFVDGAMVREFDIGLAEADPDFWVFCDVSPYRGRLLTIEAEDMTADSPALGAIRQATTVPDAAGMYHETHRPQFHYTPQRGWVNDPNGMVYYAREYHFFYQHNPYGIKWGNMHWGHAVSQDLLHWQECPEALYPDRLGTIYSGSALVDWHNTAGLQAGPEKTLVAFYTAAGGTSPQSEGQPYAQCLAYSNDRGKSWLKFAGNPVLAHVAGSNRDPKVIWHPPANRWVMVLYLDHSEFGFFASEDLRNWQLLSKIDLPGMHEVPDLFELPVDGDAQHRKWVLLGGNETFVTSQNDQQCFENGKYLVGEFDGIRFLPDSGPHPLDWGEAYYSTQTFSDIPAEDGRRIQIAWLSTDFRAEGFPGMPFHGQFCFPCELTMRTLPDGIRMCRQPVREIERLYRGRHVWQDRPLAVGRHEFSEIASELLDICADLEISREAQWELVIRGTAIHFDATQGEIRWADRAAPWRPLDGRLRLRVLVDRTSIEVFADGGAVCLSGYFVPQADAQPLQLYVIQGTVKAALIDIHDLDSVWK